MRVGFLISAHSAQEALFIPVHAQFSTNAQRKRLKLVRPIFAIVKVSNICSRAHLKKQKND